MGFINVSALKENFLKKTEDIYNIHMSNKSMIKIQRKILPLELKKGTGSKPLEVPMTCKQKLIDTRLGLHMCVMSNYV